MVLGDESNTSLPAGRGVVEDVENFELGLSVDVQQLLEVILEENIFLVDVGVDEANGGRVKGVPECGADDLDHRGDAGSACNHANVVGKARGVLEIALGALDTDLVTNLEKGNVARDVAFLVGLCEGGEVRTELEMEQSNGVTLMRRSK